MLRFYGPINPMGSCLAWSVYLTTLLLGRFSPLSVYKYCAHSFARNWQLPFLNQWKEQNDHRKYFMVNLHKRILPVRRWSNPQPPDHQSDTHPTESPRPACVVGINWNCLGDDICYKPFSGANRITFTSEPLLSRHRQMIPSWKHTYIILTPLNPTFI